MLIDDQGRPALQKKKKPEPAGGLARKEPKKFLGAPTQKKPEPATTPETSGAGNWLMQKLFNTLLQSASRGKRFSESDYVDTKKASPTPMPKARTNESFTEMANRMMPGPRLSQEEFNKLSRKRQQALRDKGQKTYAEILKRLSST